MQAWPRVLPPWDTAKVPGIPEGKWQPVTEGCCCFFDIVFLVACNKFKKFQDLDGFRIGFWADRFYRGCTENPKLALGLLFALRST